MKQQLEDIQGRALAALDAATSPAALEELRVKLLGKKGELTAVLKQMGKLSPEERPVMGQLANTVRAEIEARLERRKSAIPGIGRLLLASISNRDFPVVQAVVVILAAWIVVVNFLADLLNQWTDPRVRLR